MSGARQTRRAFVLGAAGAAGVAALPSLSNAQSAAAGPFRGKLQDGTEVISGRIAVVAPPGELRLEGDPQVSVDVETDARLWKDAEVGLEAFEPGDEVAAFGNWEGNSFVASRVEPVYHPLDGVVVAVDGQVVTTTTGSAQFSALTMRVDPARGLVPIRAGELTPGSGVQIVGRVDARTSAFLARRVYA